MDGSFKLAKQGKYAFKDCKRSHYLPKDGYTTLVIGFVRLMGNPFILPFSHLKKSHKMIQTEIQRNSIYKENLIIINSVQFNPTDFQEEGFMVAIMGWVSKAFGFQPPTINVDFDKEKNRYVFVW